MDGATDWMQTRCTTYQNSSLFYSRSGCVVSMSAVGWATRALRCEYTTITVLPMQVPNGGVLLLAGGQRRQVAARVCGVVPARRVVGATVAYRLDQHTGAV